MSGTEHWAAKQVGTDNVRLFLWRKQLGNRDATDGGADAHRGTILFVHGSSVSATPEFDLQLAGKPDASVMDWFARRGYDTWCVDCEGYGRSDKSRPVNADVACGADDLAVASSYILQRSGSEAAAGLRRVLRVVARRAVRAAASANAWRGSRSMRWSGPAKAVRPWPSAGNTWRRIARTTGERSTAPSCAAFSPATIRARATSRSSTRLPMRCSHSIPRCRRGPMST